MYFWSCKISLFILSTYYSTLHLFLYLFLSCYFYYFTDLYFNYLESPIVLERLEKGLKGIFLESGKEEGGMLNAISKQVTSLLFLENSKRTKKAQKGPKRTKRPQKRPKSLKKGQKDRKKVKKAWKKAKRTGKRSKRPGKRPKGPKTGFRRVQALAPWSPRSSKRAVFLHTRVNKYEIGPIHPVLRDSRPGVPILRIGGSGRGLLAEVLKPGVG